MPVLSSIPFVVLIPARLQSTRLERKVLADIAGLPMVVRVANQAKKSGAQRVVVATDAAEIRSVCQQYAVESVLTATHHTSGSDRLAEAAALLKLPTNTIVVNVQGDEPLIDPTLIHRVAACLNTHNECQMATAAHPISEHNDWHNPNVVKVVCDQAGRALYFSRSLIPYDRDGTNKSPSADVAPHPSVRERLPLRHVGIYAYRAQTLRDFPLLSPAHIEELEKLEQLRALWHGWKIALHISDEPSFSGVDTADDLARIRAQFHSNH